MEPRATQEMQLEPQSSDDIIVNTGMNTYTFDMTTIATASVDRAASVL